MTPCKIQQIRLPKMKTLYVLLVGILSWHSRRKPRATFESKSGQYQMPTVWDPGIIDFRVSMVSMAVANSTRLVWPVQIPSKRHIMMKYRTKIIYNFAWEHFPKNYQHLNNVMLVLIDRSELKLTLFQTNIFGRRVDIMQNCTSTFRKLLRMKSKNVHAPFYSWWHKYDRMTYIFCSVIWHHHCTKFCCCCFSLGVVGLVW